MAKRRVRYTCEYCTKQFKWECRLKDHKIVHTGNGDFKCTFCPYSTHTPGILVTHIRTHTKEKPFKCPHPNCPSAFNTSGQLNQHQIVHSNKGDDSLLKYRCQFPGCGYKTGRNTNFYHHQKIHSDVKPFSCSLCPYRAKMKKCLESHYKNVHSTERPFKCPQPNCNYSCKGSSSLNKHLERHSTERSFVCSFPECQYKGKTKNDLRGHMKLHSGEKPFKCSFCPFSSSSGSALTIHTRVHTGERPYACQSCSYKAKTSHALAGHVKSVHAEFFCSTPGCTYKSASKQDLNRHQRWHRGEKPHKCPMCSFAFKNSGNLTAHIRGHTGERPYPCQYCPHRTTRSNSLARHVKICKYNPDKCRDSKTFKERRTSTVPRMSTGLFKCKVESCSYSTKEDASLALHLINVHNLPKILW